MKQKIYSEFWGGCIMLHLVTLDELPRDAQYKYSDDNYDIYVYTNLDKGEEVFYGIAY